MAETRGWKLAPSNNADGVAAVLEAAIKKRDADGLAGAGNQ